jgi:hypothetical protein
VKKTKKPKINIKGITTCVQHPSYHVIVHGSKAQFSSMVIPISQLYQNNFCFINENCLSTCLFYLQKRTDVKNLIWIMSIISFGNLDVILFFRDKRQYFRRVSYFLGTDVIFWHVSYEYCLSTRLFFLQKKGPMSKV